MLLAKGANVNAVDKCRGTALVYAIRNGYKEVVEMLLAKGANIDVANGGTALQCAVRNGHKGIVEMLLGKGVNVDAADGGGVVVLRSEAKEWHKEIVQLRVQKKEEVQE
jgi:ankyrin repeat protein